MSSKNSRGFSSQNSSQQFSIESGHRFPSASAFLALSDELAVVDKFVCTKGDVTRALGMAVETVLNNASTNPSPAQRLKGLYATTAAAAVAGSRSGTSFYLRRSLQV